MQRWFPSSSLVSSMHSCYMIYTIVRTVFLSLDFIESANISYCVWCTISLLELLNIILFASLIYRQFWVENGIVTGGEYSSHKGCQPYEIPKCEHHVEGPFKPCGKELPTPMCSHKCESNYNKTFDQDKHFGKKSYSISNNVQQIQMEIMTNGPVEAAFTVYADFPSYKSGNIKISSLKSRHTRKSWITLITRK